MTGKMASAQSSVQFRRNNDSTDGATMLVDTVALASPLVVVDPCEVVRDSTMIGHVE
jgi:hypothetical protein